MIQLSEKHMIKAGDLITFRCLHADGKWYRRWQATIESINDACVTTYSSLDWFEDVKRGRVNLPNPLRGYYWPGKWINLTEVLDNAGAIIEVYINIASPLQIAGDELHYIDYELDVVKYPGQPARIIDQDEFAEAIELYGYSAEFQAKCWQAAEEARLLADTWLQSKKT